MNPKELPPPAGADDLTALLRSRRAAASQPVPAVETGETEDGAAPSAPPIPQRRRAPRTAPLAPAMDRRSWYMPRASAAALAAAVEDLHYATRQPKHAVLAALLAVALEHQDDARRRLTGEHE
ncbi:hypothetical protein [Candidatus Frankia nodulisporulans]|uniref:hypothetical protein n=1 Tax=Candidatus Frankia nodulisporulans TaxID=2060052 RepID=UPI0013CFA082|nr:hypothetical protein [Candidatus Frankia nodulisporulans]